jgi:hypothetical protein
MPAEQTLNIIYILLAITALAIVVSSISNVRPAEQSPKESMHSAPPQNIRTSFTTDPQETGIEKPLWGPLYPLQNVCNTQYHTMHGLPWCSPPLEQYDICKSRVPSRTEVKYDDDKM